MLQSDALAKYRRDGFVVVESVLGEEEARALCDEERRLWRDVVTDLHDPRVHWRKHDSFGRVADRLDPVSTLSARFACLSSDPRFVSVATAVLDGPCAFFKDKLITKSPGAFGYGLHADF